MRRALLRVSAGLITEMCKRDDGVPRYYAVSRHPIPQDAKAVGAAYDSLTDTFELALESESFDEVHEEGPLPILPSPEMTLHTYEEARSQAL